MNCPYCGTNCQKDWYFCPKCSRKLGNINHQQNSDHNHVDDAKTQYVAVTSNKSKKTATTLCLLGFLGIAGLHRIYVGKIWTGAILLLIGFSFIGAAYSENHGFLGILWVLTIIDLTQLLLGQFSDNVGQPLRR